MRAKFVYESESHIGANTSWTADYKGKEVKIFLKDINNYLDKKGVNAIEIDPKELEHLLIKTKRDSNRVQNASLDYPIIVVKNKGEFTYILDGQHRVVKCLTNKIDKIKARVLELEDAPEKYKFIFR